MTYDIDALRKQATTNVTWTSSVLTEPIVTDTLAYLHSPPTVIGSRYAKRIWDAMYPGDEGASLLLRELPFVIDDNCSKDELLFVCDGWQDEATGLARIHGFTTSLTSYSEYV